MLQAWAGDNPRMQRLRNAPLLARLVLVWCALFLGVATAAPLWQTGQLQMICSAGGMQLVDTGLPDGEPHLPTGMDCPLCASVVPPPRPAAMDLGLVAPLGHGLQPIVAVRAVVATAPPLPSRGPPPFA